MYPNYITVRIIKTCCKFVAGQICQMPEKKALRAIAMGNAERYDLDAEQKKMQQVKEEKTEKKGTKKNKSN